MHSPPPNFQLAPTPLHCLLVAMRLVKFNSMDFGKWSALASYVKLPSKLALLFNW